MGFGLGFLGKGLSLSPWELTLPKGNISYVRHRAWHMLDLQWISVGLTGRMSHPSRHGSTGELLGGVERDSGMELAPLLLGSQGTLHFFSPSLSSSSSSTSSSPFLPLLPPLHPPAQGKGATPVSMARACPSSLSSRHKYQSLFPPRTLRHQGEDPKSGLQADAFRPDVYRQSATKDLLKG